MRSRVVKIIDRLWFWWAARRRLLRPGEGCAIYRWDTAIPDDRLFSWRGMGLTIVATQTSVYIWNRQLADTELVMLTAAGKINI
jgi:hypothetical protein